MTFWSMLAMRPGCRHGQWKCSVDECDCVDGSRSVDVEPEQRHLQAKLMTGTVASDFVLGSCRPSDQASWMGCCYAACDFCPSPCQSTVNWSRSVYINFYICDLYLLLVCNQSRIFGNTGWLVSWRSLALYWPHKPRQQRTSIKQCDDWNTGQWLVDIWYGRDGLERLAFYKQPVLSLL